MSLDGRPCARGPRKPLKPVQPLEESPRLVRYAGANGHLGLGPDGARERLTGPQRRRLRKKANLAAKRLEATS